MKVFSFIDRIVEVKKNESLTAYYTLRGDEEFLEAHFEGFPVMPGVLLLEAVKQAAAVFLEASLDARESRYRMVSAQEVRFGKFVKPGNQLELSVRLVKAEEGFYFFEGRIDHLGADSHAAARGKALAAGFCMELVKSI